LENLLNVPKEAVVRRYDLKGSTCGRRVLDRNPQDLDEATIRAQVLKDMDFRELEPAGIFPRTGVGKGLVEKVSKLKYFKDCISQDVKFFALNGIMDYSLLLTKIDMAKVSDDRKKRMRKRGILFESGDGHGWIIGVIDIFQEWTPSKMREKFWKTAMGCNCKKDISAQPPAGYGKRFKMFCQNFVFEGKRREVTS
jgi:hypothetical protein